MNKKLTLDEAVAKLRKLIKPVYKARPDLSYHSWQHIKATLNALHNADWDGLTDEDRIAAQLALLYHDSVYVQGAKHNEEMSAQLLDVHVKYLGLTPVLYDHLLSKSKALILGTAVANHIAPEYPEWALQGLVQDCDLVSFAELDFDDFCSIQDRVLAEHVGHWILKPGAELTRDEDRQRRIHRAKSAEFLRNFLRPERNTIFRSQAFSHVETVALTNLENFINAYGD